MGANGSVNQHGTPPSEAERAAEQRANDLARELQGAPIRSVLDVIEQEHGEKGLQNCGVHEPKEPIRKGHSPLHDAARLGHHDCLRTMLSSQRRSFFGYSAVDEQDELGFTPLHSAAQSESLLSILALLRANANVKAEDTLGRTPFHLCVSAHFCLQAIIDADADLEARDWKAAQVKERHETVLHKAAAGGCAQSVDVLLRARANMEATNAWGRTPLHAASGPHTRHDCVQKLLMAGSDPCAKDAKAYKPADLAKFAKCDRISGAKMWAAVKNDEDKSKHERDLHAYDETIAALLTAEQEAPWSSGNGPEVEHIHEDFGSSRCFLCGVCASK